MEAILDSLHSLLSATLTRDEHLNLQNIIDECGGIAKLEAIQTHANDEVS